ncbi:hypothetical protein ACEPAF_7598 [Sanghuangporus sanghuang]
MEDLPHSSPAWIGKPYKACPIEQIPSLPSRVPSGLHPEVSPEIVNLVTNQGWQYIRNSGNAQVVTDCAGRLLIVKCRAPESIFVDGEEMQWLDLVAEVELAITALRQAVETEEAEEHSRGSYSCISFGNSYGGGQQSPQNMSCKPASAYAALKTFKTDRFVQAYARRVACLFRTWQPKLARLYSLTQLSIIMVNELASMCFPDSQFASCTVNFGEACYTCWHLDQKNLVFGLCAVGVFGAFDHHRSGQLMFQYVDIIMEVAPGDVVFFPSSLLPHRNAPLHAGETRQSMVFYSPGGIFRFVSQRYKSKQKDKDGKDVELEEEGKECEDGKQRWKDGCSLISNISHILQ